MVDLAQTITLFFSDSRYTTHETSLATTTAQRNLLKRYPLCIFYGIDNLDRIHGHFYIVHPDDICPVQHTRHEGGHRPDISFINLFAFLHPATKLILICILLLGLTTSNTWPL